MKTKLKYFSLAIAALLMVGFASCSSDDEPIKGVDEIETGGTKMQLVVNMPTGASTRSTTGATGIEVGTDAENKANSVLLSVFDAGGNFVASYRPTLKVSTVGDKVSYVSDVFEANALKLGNSYKVYVYINPYPEMELKAQNPNEFFKPWDTAATEEAKYLSVMNGITTERGFLMSNATTVEAKNVGDTAIVKTTPFKIVADVERAVARFDYTAANTTNTYLVGGAGDVSVKFTDYKLLNTSKQFYHLKRVNTTTAEGTQGGAETANNYVMDTDWEQKKKVVTSWTENEFNNNFYFNLKSDHVTGYKTLSTSTTDAQNLAYVIENTLPLENQSKKGLATAVVFKGHLVFGDKYDGGGGKDLDVYVWQNKLYGTWERLPAGVRGLVGSTVEDRTTANLVKAGITSYSWDATLKDGAGGYPVYYVYYNRHNDNKDPKKTGPMEFAVVRNNVYKLSISKVNLFGHSNDPQIKDPTNADPNPELPQDDIERDNIYMEVTANVLPWTMRTNVIEF